MDKVSIQLIKPWITRITSVNDSSLAANQHFGYARFGRQLHKRSAETGEGIYT